MSAKETSIELIRQMPDDATLEVIIVTLREAQATEESLRGFDEGGVMPDDDITHEDWMLMVARCWADSLNDPRDDIYTLEDGNPVADAG